WLERGEHVSMVGANGTGKTTLIEMLAGRRELLVGKLRTGHNVTIGFLSQHADELTGGSGRGGAGPAARTVLEATQRATGLTPGKARALLGGFLFSGEEAEKPLDGLSGGERRRLSLAILVHSGANVLILDEPTNHLDLESREALEAALNAFPGSLLLVSHDRALLDAVGTRTVVLEDEALHSYVGGWPEYVRVREERAKAPVAARSGAPGGAKSTSRRGQNAGHARNAKRNPPARKTSADGAARSLEHELEAAEAALRAIEDDLSDPAAWSTSEATARSSARHEEAKRAVADLYERWGAVTG
ncbi:MAG: ATP-binding cassette domain-containing protein, partial [Solirubrobacteraceae bacterium]